AERVPLALVAEHDVGLHLRERLAQRFAVSLDVRPGGEVDAHTRATLARELRSAGRGAVEQRVTGDVESVAFKPGRIDVSQRARRAAVGRHGALTVRADERHDDAGLLSARSAHLDSAGVELAPQDRAGVVLGPNRDDTCLNAERRGPGRNVRSLA